MVPRLFEQGCDDDDDDDVYERQLIPIQQELRKKYISLFFYNLIIYQILTENE